MLTTYQLPKLPVLHGTALTRLSDDEFFELCQANPALCFERNTQHEIISTPPPAPKPANRAWKARASCGS